MPDDPEPTIHDHPVPPVLPDGWAASSHEEPDGQALTPPA